MKYLSGNLLRKDLNLEKRWWHRLTKIFFIILSIVVLISSVYGFYSAEETNARRYKIVRNFKDFLEIEQKKLLKEGELDEVGCPINQKGFNFRCLGRVLATDTFLSKNDNRPLSAEEFFEGQDVQVQTAPKTIPFGASPKSYPVGQAPWETPSAAKTLDYSLGCLNKSDVPEYLSEYSFKDNVICDQKTGLNCYIPQSICGGIASNIVKYDYEIRYGFYNYFSIAIKTLSVLLGWILLTYLIYYKALLYIIFGGRKHADNSSTH